MLSRIGWKKMDLFIQQTSKLFQRIKGVEQTVNNLRAELTSIRTDFENIIMVANSGLGNGGETFLERSGSNSASVSAKKRRLSEDLSTDIPDYNNAKKNRNHDNDIPRENDFVVVYTDGACENNGKPNAKAGIGVWFSDGNSLNVSEPVVGRATNNTAEIQACTKALTIIKGLGFSKVKIITDSQFTINCMTKWIQNWKRKGWKVANGNPVKNKEDLEKLDSLVKNFSEIQWVHCDGHAGVKGNEAADKLAKQGALQYKH